MGEEGGAGPNVLGSFQRKLTVNVNNDPLKFSFLCCKITQMVLCIIAILLSQFWPFEGTKHWRRDNRTYTDAKDAIVFTTLYGYLLINAVLIAARTIGEELSTKMLMIFSSIAVLLNITVGIWLMNFDDIIEELPDRYRSQLRPVAFTCLLNAAVFIAETLCTRKFANYDK